MTESIYYVVLTYCGQMDLHLFGNKKRLRNTDISSSYQFHFNFSANQLR
jgi:hypothetical protein